jgi:uroporphyrinogen decarboxylase
MGRLSGRERILTALRRQEPDVVPHMELWLNPLVAEKILPGGGSIEDLTEYLDLDGIAYYTVSMETYEVLDKSKGIIRDKWGVIKRDTGQTTPHPIEPVIKSEKDLESYSPPDPNDPSRYEPLKRMVERFKGERAVVAIVEQPFMRVSELRGAEDHFADMIINPDLILQLNAIVVKHHLEVLRNFIEVGADIICFSGDFATKDALMASPQHLKKFGIEPLAKLVDFSHRQELPCILHSDGDIMPIMEMLLGTGGIDGLHPIDPVAGLDIGEVKEQYGDRLCLIGSIDCGPLMMWGTKEQVRQAVKENIRKAGKGGGLIAASSHSIQSKTKPENYVEMVKAIREYGTYPLSLD